MPHAHPRADRLRARRGGTARASLPVATSRLLHSALALLLLLVPALPAAAQSTRTLLGRASEYVARYEAELPSVVADERYVQIATEGPPDGTPSSRTSRRVLESEFAWVRLPGLNETVGVREVRRIDDLPTAAGARLRSLLEHPPPDPLREIRGILAESARHNLGADQRNFNFPTFALVYLRADRARRLTWSSSRRDGLVELRFTEPDRGTVVHTAEGRPIAATGRFAIEPVTGRVERAEVQLKEARPGSNPGPVLTYEMTVTFSDDPKLRLWLPSAMQDTYDREFSSRERLRVQGAATYTNYRRYEGEGRLVR